MSSRNKFYLPLVLVLTINVSFQDLTPRRLLLFGKGQFAFQTQKRWLEKDSLGVAEREIRIEKAEFNSELAKRYHIKSGQFTVLLIGKDGGEKFRGNEAVTAKRLFGIIDAMPMRQLEIREKRGSRY